METLNRFGDVDVDTTRCVRVCKSHRLMFSEWKVTLPHRKLGYTQCLPLPSSLYLYSAKDILFYVSDVLTRQTSSLSELSAWRRTKYAAIFIV